MGMRRQASHPTAFNNLALFDIRWKSSLEVHQIAYMNHHDSIVGSLTTRLDAEHKTVEILHCNGIREHSLDYSRLTVSFLAVIVVISYSDTFFVKFILQHC